MNILRWLLCHLLLVIVLLSLSLGYVFRDSLKADFNRMTGNKVQLGGQQNVKTNPSASMPAAVAKGTSEIKNNEPGRFELRQNSQAENDPLSNKQNTDVASENSSIAGTATDPWGQMLPSQPGANKPVEAETNSASTVRASIFPPDDYVPEENGSPPGHSGSKFRSERSAKFATDSPANRDIVRSPGQAGKLNTNESSSKSIAYNAALTNVRKLYWDGKTGTAQKMYEKLMFEYPEYPEAAAELGNIFLQQGNRKAASWAYQNAIPRYLNLHREQEAINLMRFISQYDPAIAESLQKKYW